MKKLAAAAVMLLPLLIPAAVPYGGWAVVSIENPPDFLTVDKPTDLIFHVRAHGREPLGGLQTSVEARNGETRVKGRAWETPTKGVYRAALTVPSAGDWTVTIRTNFGRSGAETLPWRAIDARERVPALTAAARGRRLFAARGCVSCHVHRAVDIEGEASTTGPDLTQPRLAARYVAQFLADPSIKPPTPNRMQMPNLRLRDGEIQALVAFLTREERLGRRE